MFNRRNSLPVGRLLFSIAFIFIVIALLTQTPADARRKKRQQSHQGAGPQVIANQPWPPAIAPDFMEVLKRDRILIANKYGRLSIVDFKNAGKKQTEPKLLSELTGIGKKLVSVSSYKNNTYCLVNKSLRGETVETLLVSVDTRRMEEPSVVSSQTIAEMREGRLLKARNNLILVAGKSKSNENVILVIDSKKKRDQGDGLNIVSTITTQLPVTDLDFDGRQLIALGSNGEKSMVSFINLASKTSPQLDKNLDLTGDYQLLSRYKNLIVLGGSDKNGKPEARSITLKPAPDVVAGVTLGQLEKITSLVATAKEVLVSGQSKQGSRLLSLSIDQHANLLTATEITRNTAKRKGTENSCLVSDGSTLFLASGWSGIETLKQVKGAWLPQYLYTIPRMGASGMASWGNSAVLSAGELIKYDLSDPENPRIESKTAMTTPVKEMVGAGSFILCLTKDALLLKKMEKIDQTIAEEKLEGKGLAFDKEQHRAYVIQPYGKLTRIHPFKVYSDSLDAQTTVDVPGNYTRIKVVDGKILLFDLNDICLWTLDAAGGKAQKTGERHFDNYAVRDAWLLDEHIVATTVDKSSKGFLLVLSNQDEGLNIVGNTPLPHDGTAVSAKGSCVATIGQNDKGKALLTLVDIKNPTQPQQKESLPVIEAAASISVRSRVTLVAGRGLEILAVDTGTSAENNTDTELSN